MNTLDHCPVSCCVCGNRVRASPSGGFTSDVTADTALSEGLTTVYRNDPRLGAMPRHGRACLLGGVVSARDIAGPYVPAVTPGRLQVQPECPESSSPR